VPARSAGLNHDHVGQRFAGRDEHREVGHVSPS
jgi:hypothetical protein